MSKVLTTAQVDAYHRDGFLFPFTAMTPAEAHDFRAELENFESMLGSKTTQAEAKYGSRSYLLFDWAERLVCHPKILDAVEDLIGPDILVFNAHWFIKEPGTANFAAWHQDSTFFGLQPNHLHVTAWLALSDASAESGCMEFLPGTPSRGQLPHGTGLSGAVTGAGQFIDRGLLNEDVIARCSLLPGQFSLHNTLLVHRSGPNHSNDRRIGLGISYIPTSVRHLGSERHPAHLVRGEDRFGHFDLDPAPSRDFSDQARAVHAQSHRRFQALYNEQVAKHGRESTTAG